MSVIGTFSKSPDGYAGTIRTMTINVKAKVVANDKNGNDKAPDFKLVVGDKEFGAAWRAKAKGADGKPFLRVELDDPRRVRVAVREMSDQHGVGERGHVLPP